MSDQDGTGRLAVQAKYFRILGGGLVQCLLCPHACTLAEGQSGQCKVRRNSGGTLVLPYYGAISAIALDPIEKKPLYHFLPGSRVFSIGYLGCNLKCPFCQNYHISQSTTAPTRFVSAGDLMDQALESGCPSVAHTYSEPLVHFEFVRECMVKARKLGLKNVLVTNGCILPDPAREILSSCDAVNVDLKSWSGQWYQEELGGHLPSVTAFIEEAVRQSVHVEVTTLVIPGKNDGEAEMDCIAAFLASVSPDIPLHLSAYRPMYKYSVRATPRVTLEKLEKIARSRLKYVHLGNI